MRAAWLVTLIALGCARRGGPAVQNDGAGGSEPPKRRAGEALLIGNAQRFGTKTCKTWRDEAWSDVHFRAGLVRLEGDTVNVAAFAGKPLLLLGEVAQRGAPQLPAVSESCPPVQSRSDWIDAPDGLILKRDGGPKIAAFRVRAIQEISPLSASRRGDTLAVELVNPLDVPIQGAAITVHYEGCYRKPMPHGERREVGELAPGAKAQASVPAFARAASRSEELHHPISIQAHGTGPGIYVDLDLRLATLGIDLPCPDR